MAMYDNEEAIVDELIRIKDNCPENRLVIGLDKYRLDYA